MITIWYILKFEAINTNDCKSLHWSKTFFEKNEQARHFLTSMKNAIEMFAVGKGTSPEPPAEIEIFKRNDEGKFEAYDRTKSDRLHKSGFRYDAINLPDH